MTFDSDTTAKLTDRSVKDEDDVDTSGSKLRKQSAPLLADEDTRYAGKKVSRKRLLEEEDLDLSGMDISTRIRQRQEHLFQ